jgi:hypothetical protein
MQKWECVIGYNGARSCKQTASGTHASLGDCMQKEKCYQN